MINTSNRDRGGLIIIDKNPVIVILRLNFTDNSSKINNLAAKGNVLAEDKYEK
jgi:hypothetical protein